MSIDLSKMQSVDAAAKAVGMSRTVFWRFRKRHSIPMLSNRKVHMDDVEHALNVERGLAKPLR